MALAKRQLAQRSNILKTVLPSHQLVLRNPNDRKGQYDNPKVLSLGDEHKDMLDVLNGQFADEECQEPRIQPHVILQFSIFTKCVV